MADHGPQNRIMQKTMLKNIRKNRSIGGDKRGIAAVEFALIAPILIIMVLGSVDAVFALTAKRKVAIASHSMADIAARGTDLKSETASTINELGRLIMTPFNVADANVVLSTLVVDAGGQTATVDISYGYGPSPATLARGSSVALSAPLRAGTNIVLSSIELPYTTLLGFLEKVTQSPMIHFEEESYFPTRSGNPLTP